MRTNDEFWEFVSVCQYRVCSRRKGEQVKQPIKSINERESNLDLEDDDFFEGSLRLLWDDIFASP